MRSRRVFARAPARPTSPGRCHASSGCSPRRRPWSSCSRTCTGRAASSSTSSSSFSATAAGERSWSCAPPGPSSRTGGRVGGRGANTVSVALERLDDTETRRLLTYASPGLGDEQARQIIDAAEGNPLFAEHLAALVGDEVAPAGLPRSLQVLLAARLEALPEPEQEVVGVAAVVGRDFAVDAVEAMVGRPIEAELDRLDQRELTERTAPGRARFGHALLQDAAYGLLPKLRRCELHVSLAHWLAERGASDAEVGDHLEHAYRLRADLELLDDETVQLGAEAGAHLAAAGRRADAMGDPRRARFLLDRALALLPERSTERAAALVELAAAGFSGRSSAACSRRGRTSPPSSGRGPSSSGRGSCSSARCRRTRPTTWTSARRSSRRTPPSPSSRRWMHRAPSRLRSAPAERPSGGSARRRRGSSRCARRSPSRARPTRTRSGRQRSSLRWSTRRCPSRTASSSSAS